MGPELLQANVPERFPPQTPHPQKPPLPKAAAARGACSDCASALALETDSRSCTGELQENNKPTTTLLYSLVLFLKLSYLETEMTFCCFFPV